MKCSFCGSENVKTNSAGTKFCFNCHINETRRGNVERMVDHPLRETLGYRIKKSHPDAFILKGGENETSQCSA